MKAKKLLLCGIVAVLSVPMMAASAQDILKQARDDYYKSLKTPKEPKMTTEKLITIDEDGVVEEKEVVKRKSPIEKLEYKDKLIKKLVSTKKTVDLTEEQLKKLEQIEKQLKDAIR